MMKTIINNFGTERLAGLATTLVVVIICMVILFQPENPNYPRIVVASLLFVSFLGLEILVTPDTPCSDGMYLFLNGLQVATYCRVFYSALQFHGDFALCLVREFAELHELKTRNPNFTHIFNRLCLYLHLVLGLPAYVLFCSSVLDSVHFYHGDD